MRFLVFLMVSLAASGALAYDFDYNKLHGPLDLYSAYTVPASYSFERQRIRQQIREQKLEQERQRAELQSLKNDMYWAKQQRQMDSLFGY